MGFEKVLFYIFSAIAVFGALGVISVRNPVHSVLFLVLTFFSSACLWLLLEAEFLAITLVLVYVGAVMVLFLFVVMMLDINLVPVREGFARYMPLALVVAAAIIGQMLLLIISRRIVDDSALTPVRRPAEYSNTEALGQALYTDYLLAFELAAVILLVAIVAAIVLTLRRRENTKHQDPGRQVSVTASQRLRIVRMPAERPRAAASAATQGQQHDRAGGEDS